MTELDVAEQIRDGILPSPQCLGAMELWSIRITGTGASYRAGLREFVWRDASNYLTAEFCRRCQGLPVVWEHPEEKSKLDTEEFGNRIVGTVMLPYIKGDEVWAVCRLYDAEAISQLRGKQFSTSPGVVFLPEDGSETFELDSGETFLIEGKPSLLDHVALVPAGVWDKGGAPNGIAPISEITIARQDTITMSLSSRERATLSEADAFMRSARAELSAADRNIMEQARHRFDSVAAQLGIASAPDPALGESANSYRGRLLSKLAPRTQRFSTSRFDSADSAILDLMEQEIAKDLKVTVRNDANAGPGRLIAVRERDETGRMITRFEGDIGACFGPFMHGGMTLKIDRSLCSGERSEK